MTEETMRKIVSYNGYAHECDKPKPEDIRRALDNMQILWRWKNGHIQVLAQTLSNCLKTRTSSLLAVNKKQGVPSKYIHREWKVTWIDLEGLKKRVENTEHGSLLLDNLKQVIKNLDGRKPAGVHPPIEKPANALKRCVECKQTKRNPIDVCEVAVEANKRAVHNTERLNKLTRDEAALENLIFKYRDACSTDLFTQSKRLDMFADRLHRIEAGDKQAVQAMAEKRTPFDALSQRVSGIVTHADRLDIKTEGLVSRVSVLEDTSKWLSWTLAGVIGLRFLSVMLRLLKCK